MTDLIKIRRALISCWDKTGIVPLSSKLVENGVSIISSGGTYTYLLENKIPVTRIEDITGFPEILDGRVKTLHPFIHGAILARRIPKHLDQLAKQSIQPIDLVVVNLYPFLRYTQTDGKTLAEMIELIDIGGPAMLRAAAKNHEHVVLLYQPDQYETFLKLFEENNGSIPVDFSRSMAAKAFFYTAYYDSQISSYLMSQIEKTDLPSQVSMFFLKQQDLRYGENPHQKAALYRIFSANGGDYQIEQLHGKEMSFNNYVDVTAAYGLIAEFEEPSAAIIKHTNPCGVAAAENLAEAFSKALAGDPISAFGGIIALNRIVDKETAELIYQSFYECVIAPDYFSTALEILQKKKNLRLLKCKLFDKRKGEKEYKYLNGCILMQDVDTMDYDPDRLESVVERKPTKNEREDLLFAWKIVKHVKSNAIVFVKNKQLIGVGAGQMSRVDAVKLARMKAQELGHDTQGAVMASDAFFPFRDGIDEAAKAGIQAVIQPGGSKRDNEVIEAASQHGMAMLFTGVRHFKH